MGALPAQSALKSISGECAMTRCLPAALLVSALSACAAPGPGLPAEPAETAPAPKAVREHPPEPIPDRQTVTADQVAPAEPSPEGFIDNVLQQLSAPDDGRILGMDVVEVSDPCLEDALRDTERCRDLHVASSPASRTAQQPEVTLRIVRPDQARIDSFDPDRTVDEIGRGQDQLSSAAQFLGADLLAPPPEPEKPETDMMLETEQAIAAGILLVPPPTE